MRLFILTVLPILLINCGGGGSSESSSTQATVTSSTVSPSQSNQVCLENYERAVCTILQGNNSSVTINPAGSCNTLIPNPAIVISGANLSLPATDPQWTKFPQVQVYSGSTDPVSCYYMAQ